MTRLAALPMLLLAVAATAPDFAPEARASSGRQDKGHEWAKGVPYLTDFDAAIKQAKETGRILFIYNGWEGPNI